MALINGTDANDNITGDRAGVAERDIINGLAGEDILNGLGGNDSLNGGDGRDMLIGDEGDDFLAGNRGDDLMFAGNGNDRMFWIDGDGSDSMFGGVGSDTVEFVGSARAGDSLTLGQDPGRAGGVVLSRTNLVPITLNIVDVETINVAGVEGDDSLFINRLGETALAKINFSGGAGNDILSVSNNPMPQIDARGDAGNDNLSGGNQNDILNGGAGNDSLFGGGGNDILTGADTTNIAAPGRGEVDTLVSGGGRDRFVLGDRGGLNSGRRVFYDDGNNAPDGDINNAFNGIDGTGDFAIIVDFASGQDTVQLAGAPSEYVLRAVGGSLSGGSSAIQDMGIFRKNGPTLFQPDELLAVVRDAGNTLNLNNQSQFVYV